MKFTIDNKELQTLLTDIQIKGKHLTATGFKSSSLGTDVHISVYDNVLTLWNADQTFVVCIQHSVEVDESDEGECVVDADAVIAYLKKSREILRLKQLTTSNYLRAQSEQLLELL